MMETKIEEEFIGASPRQINFLTELVESEYINLIQKISALNLMKEGKLSRRLASFLIDSLRANKNLCRELDDSQAMLISVPELGRLDK